MILILVFKNYSTSVCSSVSPPELTGLKICHEVLRTSLKHFLVRHSLDK